MLRVHLETPPSRPELFAAAELRNAAELVEVAARAVRNAGRELATSGEARDTLKMRSAAWKRTC
jgi:hypothetical protein